MAHYVQELVDDAMEKATDEEIAFFYRWKKALERGDFVLNRGEASEISALDLLWQDYPKYDQLGHARLAFRLWYGVLCHSETYSATFQVGGEPCKDSGVEMNNRLLSEAQGPFKARFWGGSQDEDGEVLPQKGSRFRVGSIPLEVGSVAPANLLMRLFRARAFARWPYESKFVYVFEPPYDPKGFSLSRLMNSHLRTCRECMHNSNMDFVAKEANIREGITEEFESPVLGS